MKTLLETINEKLKVTKSGYKFNPDIMNDKTIILYDSSNYDDVEEESSDWSDCNSLLDKLEKDIDGFLLMNEPISKSKNLEKDADNIYTYWDDIKDKVITGKDHGYCIRINSGHIEIDCINSGSSNTYYVYGLSKDGMIKLEEWFAGEEYELKDLLLDENNYIAIDIEKYWR